MSKLFSGYDSENGGDSDDPFVYSANEDKSKFGDCSLTEDESDGFCRLIPIIIPPKSDNPWNVSFQESAPPDDAISKLVESVISQTLSPDDYDNIVASLDDFPNDSIAIVPSDPPLNLQYAAVVDKEPENWSIYPSPLNEEPKFQYFDRPESSPSFAELTGDKLEDPAEYWKLLITEDILQKVIDCTNEKARENLGPTWEDMDMVEFCGFIGLAYYLGINDLQSFPIERIFLTDSKATAYISATMDSTDRFESIMRFLSCYDEFDTQFEDDPLAEIREIFDIFVNQCQLAYCPGNLTLKEMVVEYDGVCKIRSSASGTPNKLGINIRCLCDSEAYYVCNAQIDCSSLAIEESKPDPPSQIALELLAPYLNTGRTVTCGNDYTSISLAETLLERGTYLVGTVRPKSDGIPVDLLGEKLNHGESRFLFRTKKRRMTLLKYQGKRNKSIYLLSTIHPYPMITKGGDGKPAIVQYYNKEKHGSTCTDELINKYKCRIITYQWPNSIFSWMLNVAAQNAACLYALRNPTRKESLKFENTFRRVFVHELAVSLMKAAQKRQAAITGSYYMVNLQSILAVQNGIEAREFEWPDSSEASSTGSLLVRQNPSVTTDSSCSDLKQHAGNIDKIKDQKPVALAVKGDNFDCHNALHSRCIGCIKANEK